MEVIRKGDMCETLFVYNTLHFRAWQNRRRKYGLLYFALQFTPGEILRYTQNSKLRSPDK
jgi:hypothetical protein